MKNLFTLVLFLFSGLSLMAQPSLPIDWEADIDYMITDFGGGVLSRIANPAMSGINTSANTGQMVKFEGEPFGGAVITLAGPIDFTTNRLFRAKVNAPAVGTRVLLKVEDLNDGGIFFEKEVATTVANEWEMLEFDFTSVNTANSYQKIVLIFDNGTVGDGGPGFTYLIDDIELVEGESSNPIELPITFEDPEVDYGLTDFGGNASMLVPDPTDASNTVAQAIKTGGAEVWAGTTIGPNGLGSPVPFSLSATKMSVRVWSPDAGIPVLLKVEDAGDPTISVETSTMTTVAGDWEVMEFDFANHAPGTAPLNVANNYNKVSIFFNFGTSGADAGEKTYYFDDIRKIEGGGGTAVDLPITFDDTSTIYGLTDFGGNMSMIVVDPTDATNMVAQTLKPDFAELWAGTTAGGAGLANPIPFTMDDTKMTVRVWSPTANTPIRLKVEDAADPTISVETEALTTVAMEWETLTFDFTNQVDGTAAINFANTYNKVSIFFNFGTTGADAGAQTYFWDDVMMEMPTSIDVLDASANNINIGPVPANDFLQIELPGSINETARVAVFDMSGRQILNGFLNESISQLNVSSLNNGTYILRLDTEDAVYTDKFMILK